MDVQSSHGRADGRAEVVMDVQMDVQSSHGRADGRAEVVVDVKSSHGRAE